MNPSTDLGIQSFCFRNFKDNAEVARLIRQCGAAAVEVCAVHADFTKPDLWAGIVDTYRKAGVRISSIGVQNFANLAANEEKFFECAKLAGAKMISAHFGLGAVPDAYRTVEKLADKFDINIGIHNHGGKHWLGNIQMLAHILANTSPRIGMCIDTAWALDAGEDPVAMVEKFGQRLYGVHIKDFIFDRAGKHQDVVVGTGNLALPALMAALKKVGFAGCLTLEYEGDVTNPVPALQECVQKIQQASAA